MKIGILTLTPKNNYGGILQAVALYSYLENNGHDVVLINKERFKKNFVMRVAIGLMARIPFQNIKNKRKDYLKEKQLEPFIDKYLRNKTKKILSSSDLKDLVEDEEFDAVVVGSDQVWRYQYIGDGHYSAFFLDFDISRPVKKIAYAASFGKDEWEAPEHINEVSHLLGKFDAISTREKSGVELCLKTFGISGASNVLDPTMLVGPSFYDVFLNGFKKISSQRTIATYILDSAKGKDEVIAFVKADLESKLGSLHQVNLSEPGGEFFYSVEDWLWQIKNAEFIVTDSFHGMIFSILFEKQFLVIGNARRGLSRFTELLSELGLGERLILNKSVGPELLKDQIDYSVVKEKLEALRDESALFLRNSIEH